MIRGKWRHVRGKQATLHFKRCSLKKYGKMKFPMTSCTRKTSNVSSYIRFTVLIYFSLFNLLFFHIFHIISLFNWFSFHTFQILSLFNFLFFHMFLIFFSLFLMILSNQNVCWFYGRRPSWIVKRYGKYGRKQSWIVKRYGNTEETKVELWNDMENMEVR
jgi:hypothetical protein